MWSSKNQRTTQASPRNVFPLISFFLNLSTLRRNKDPQGYLAPFYTYMNFTSLDMSLPVITVITRQIATIRFDMKESVQFE